jgi:DNA-binding winged helix-turn-helix (wHTH) protein/TolB-like protein/Tfp pilus assembly protein PilF
VNPEPAQSEVPNFVFDGFRVDTVKRLVYSENGEPIPLKAKAFETLVYLVENSGRVVERDELLSALWPDTVVEENNLTQHISALRRALGEKPDDHRYIATIPGRGYKFVAEVSRPGTVVDDRPARLADPVQEKKKLPKFALLAGIALLAVVVIGGLYVYWNRETEQEFPQSIAVLPFKPLVAGKSDESLEMGMADTLISKLADIDGLVVRPLTAVRRFTAVDQDSVEAGRMLGVDAVLDGSIQLADDRVRVSAKLVRVIDSNQLWTSQFDEKLTDIFAVQDSISERVAAALQVRLARQSRQHPTNNPDAYQLYARGKFHSFKLTPPEMAKALEYFQRAIEIDPNYALAYSGISDTNRSLALSAELAPVEYFEKSLVAARKAIELDDQLPESHIALAMVSFWYMRDWATTETEFKRALELDPNSAFGHLYYAHLLSNVGRHAEAVEEARKARVIDPVSPFVSSVDGLILLQAGRVDDAIAQLDKASEVDPNFWMPPTFKARALIEKKMFQEAEVSAHRATELSSGQSISLAYEIYAAAKMGNREKAAAVMKQLTQRANERYVPPYHLAIAYIGLGDRENALKLLEQGVSEHDPKVVFLKVEHTWDELRSEPRFVEMMKKMKLE